ncbi:uncharacterized protein LOC115089731 isoform X2 [Rhinatrema bivittatum]|uniref:uncharacterized protein LOC115089731 isoform X2 n=1 Tax=Rhinatrema bivittatum TaxID=194408 RepID=UPI00112B3BC2|nr:uncharacterized protein LOC115089731 isoform X2 [Rhinatrema bivittatum]
MSASGSRKRRRARGRRGTGSDSCNLMESDTSPDLVDTLTLKYMKCKVDSSTDSESDTNTEGFTSTTPQGKKSGDMSLQFLDPYDGDSEETSAHSDGSSSSKYLLGHGEIHSLLCGVQNQAALEEASKKDVCLLRSEQESLSSFMSWGSPSLETNDVFMQPLTDLGISLGAIDKGTWACSTAAEPPAHSLDCGVIAEPSGFGSSQFMLLTIDPLKSPEEPLVALLHEHNPKSEIGTEFTSNASVAKRKLGLTILDYGGGEKLLKKQRMAERSTVAQT